MPAFEIRDAAPCAFGTPIAPLFRVGGLADSFNGEATMANNNREGGQNREQQGGNNRQGQGGNNNQQQGGQGNERREEGSNRDQR